MDAVVQRALDALSRRDDDAIREVLHPYLHWTRADGTTIRGRGRMLAELDGRVPPGPASVELRDGQIYRWVEEAQGFSGVRGVGVHDRGRVGDYPATNA